VRRGESVRRERPRSARPRPLAPSFPHSLHVPSTSTLKIMGEREIVSLTQQLMYAYGANRRASRPLQYHLCSLKGKLLESCKRMTGFDNWQVDTHEGSYLDVFERSRLVYLSSEGAEVLTRLEADAVYIIGGLVDHNKHKGLTHERATRAGVRTARLPIDEHLQMHQRRVLAVNHVFEILLHFGNCNDWTEAFMRAIPQRRGAHTRTESAHSPTESSTEEKRGPSVSDAPAA